MILKKNPINPKIQKNSCESSTLNGVTFINSTNISFFGQYVNIFNVEYIFQVSTKKKNMHFVWTLLFW